MIDQISVPENPVFRTSANVYNLIRSACEANRDIAKFVDLGNSEGGRSFAAAVLGNGSKTISLLGGAHSDEPVGPETLRTFILEGLAQREKLGDLFKKYRFAIIPHINPDGEAKNRAWISQWPDLGAYIRHTFREKPGRDLEFGYPAMRVENRLVSQFLQQYAPFAMHASLHGMAFSEGAFLLIERHWIERTKILRKKFKTYAVELGMNLHNHDRNGEKGFLYIGPGFTTTPEGRAMQSYFHSLDDEATANLFHLSSMEYVRSLGGDPLCLVTELPLFDIRKKIDANGKNIPAAYLAFKKALPEVQKQLAKGGNIDAIVQEFKIQPLDLKTAIRFHLHVLKWGLETITDISH